MFKKFLSSILTVVFVMSMIPAAYAEQPRAGETLKDFYSSLSFTGMSGGSFGDGAGRGFGGGLTIKGAGAGRETGSSFGGGAGRGDWGSGFNKNYGLTLTGSGANNNFQYNDISSVTNITIANTTNNTFYNPVTNNYNTYNNISYNNAFNTYYMEGDKYNSYITNNSTYISYYVIDNSVQETYYYEIYYQLPDGRNSYDLAPEDVWGTYFIYNATNYREVLEDDGITLGLWHLDGNLNNSAGSNSYGVMPSPKSYSYVESPFDGAILIDHFSNNSVAIDSPLGPYTLEYRIKVLDVDVKSLPKSYSQSGVTPGTTAALVGDTISGWNFFNIPKVDSSLKPENIYDRRINDSPYEPVVFNRWYSCAVVYDGALFRFYLNGRCISTKKYNDQYFIAAYDMKTYTIGFSSQVFVSYNYPNPNNYYNTSCGYGLASYVIDEVRLSNKVLYTENYTPRTQPFDTNKVLVVPDPAGMTDTTIAVKTSVPVGSLRVGGVRSTYPANGDIYVVEEKGIVKDVQQYQTDGWYSVQASLYTGGEWKLLSNYDISNLGLNKPDSGGSGSGGGSGDSDGSGSGGGGSGGSGSGDTDISDSSLWNKLFGALASAVGAVFKGLLTVLATFAEGFASVVSTLTQLFTSLIGLGGEFSDFTGSFFSWLPAEIVGLLSLSITLGIVMAVIRFFWK